MSFEESYLGGLRALVGPQPLIVVGVRVLITDEKGRILILKRADDGLWALPAGAMELNETVTEAAARETFEETNIKVQDMQVFGISSDPQIEHHTYPNGDRIQNVAILFHGKADGTLHANDGEAVKFRFVALDEIAQDGFARAEYPTLKHYQQFLETGAFQMV